MKKLSLLVLIMLTLSSFVFSQNIKFEKAQPLSDVVSTTLRPVKSGELKVPLITWGADIATIYTEQNGIFKNNGLNTKFIKEDDFKKQVQMCLNGETPFLRGTLGMINASIRRI